MFLASMRGALGPPGYGGGGSEDILAGCLCGKDRVPITAHGKQGNMAITWSRLATKAIDY